MTLKQCGFCDNKVPERGQCNKCGFIDGLTRQPSDGEFVMARKVNEDHNYGHFKNIDMVVLEAVKSLKLK